MAIAIFTILLAQMRTKPMLERVQRHCVTSVISKTTAKGAICLDI